MSFTTEKTANKILTELEQREENLLGQKDGVNETELEEIINKNWEHDNRHNHVNLDGKKTTTISITRTIIIDLLPEEK